VNQEIETAKLLTDAPESFVDFFLFGNVARQQQRAGHRFAGEGFNILLRRSPW
jgi:hypothetical protein